MTKWKRANPNGTRDYLFEECTLIEEVEQKLRRTFLERGYEEIRTPTIEFYDVFAFQSRPIDEEKMYKFFDEKGRDYRIASRYDNSFSESDRNAEV